MADRKTAPLWPSDFYRKGGPKNGTFLGAATTGATQNWVSKNDPPFFKIDVPLVEGSWDIVEVRRRQQLGNGSTGRCRGSLWGKHLCA